MAQWYNRGEGRFPKVAGAPPGEGSKAMSHVNHGLIVAMLFLLLTVNPASLKAHDATDADSLDSVSSDGDSEDLVPLSLLVHPERADDKRFVLAGLGAGLDDFRLASPRLRADAEVALAAVTLNGDNAELISAALQDDETVMTAAARHSTNGSAFRWASPRLKGDKEFFLKLMAGGCPGRMLLVAGDELKEDRDVVLAAVARDPVALSYAAAPFRDDKETVLAAVNAGADTYGEVMKSLSSRLRDDKETMLAAIKRGWRAFPYISLRLRDDKDIAMAAVAIIGEDLQWASARLKADTDVVGQAVRSNPSAIRYALTKP
jgi:hypothetical protein